MTHKGVVCDLYSMIKKLDRVESGGSRIGYCASFEAEISKER